jgi:hypothetical protein
MGNGDDCAVLELLRDQCLDLLLCHDVDVCSSLVKKDDLVLTKDGTADAD